MDQTLERAKRTQVDTDRAPSASVSRTTKYKLKGLPKTKSCTKNKKIGHLLEQS